MFDPDEILKRADAIVSSTAGPWASLPSEDVQIAAVTRALCAELQALVEALAAPRAAEAAT